MANARLCSIPDCDKTYCARGYCSTHYKSIIQKGYVRPQTEPCTVAGCESFSHGHGYCIRHYKRFLKYGDPLAGSTAKGDPARFIDDLFVRSATAECIPWPYARSPQGCGQIRINGALKLASRVVCERYRGPPPTAKHQAAHLCGKGHEGCVNRDHLSWKTQTENEQDKILHGTSWDNRVHPWEKLTPEDVRAIRKLRADGVGRDALADRFGVTPNYIYILCARRMRIKI